MKCAILFDGIREAQHVIFSKSMSTRGRLDRLANHWQKKSPK